MPSHQTSGFDATNRRFRSYVEIWKPQSPRSTSALGMAMVSPSWLHTPLTAQRTTLAQSAPFTYCFQAAVLSKALSYPTTECWPMPPARRRICICNQEHCQSGDMTASSAIHALRREVIACRDVGYCAERQSSTRDHARMTTDYWCRPVLCTFAEPKTQYLRYHKRKILGLCTTWCKRKYACP